MWKVLIADDEPKIRRGIKMSIDWENLNMDICGMASNGKEAFEMVQELKPDICLIDICMPFWDGLKAIERIHQIKPNLICIVISGYDDFEYAQKAISIDVFEYILKPVDENKLKETLIRAINVLDRENSLNNRLKSAEITLKKNIEYLREQFLNDIICDRVTEEEICEIASIYQIDNDAGYAVMKIVYREELGMAESKLYNKKLFEFAIRNILQEILNNYGVAYFFNDQNGYQYVLLKTEKENMLIEIKRKIIDSVATFLKHKIIIYDGYIHNLKELKYLYEEWAQADYNDLSLCVATARNYIDNNYANVNLSVAETARVSGVNVSYLSRRFKAEIGSNAVEYITKVRIVKSLSLLSDPDRSICDIAESVGYKTQHYYCVAFKKVLGITPTEYRKKY